MRQCRAACASFAAAALLASTTLNSALAADAGTLLSPAALSRSSGTGTGGSAITQPPLASPALQAQIALSAANLTRAAKDLSAMVAAQTAASASSQLTLGNANLSGSSWNGTALSGLNPRDSDPTQWINADALKKDTATATATVKQTAATALLTWQSFDLNKGEKLVFDQQGNADWTVLNRVVAGPRDASGSRFVASPSMILGTIEAPGSVYVINPNGVIFGPNAQVNVHSLIASSLDVGSPNMPTAERNSFFLNTGILGSGSTVPAESFSYNPADTKIEGDIVVQAGAKITASLAPRSVSPDAGGFVYLFAPNVENRGTISTPAGETMMVAAQAVQLIANGYPDGLPGEASSTTSGTFRAVGVNTVLGAGSTIGNLKVTGSPIIWRQDGPASARISAPGKVTNSGLISAERGVVILNGDLVTNGSSGGSGPGVIQANTSVTRNGQIFLDARLQVTLGGGSLQILPTENGETIPDSALGSFAPGSIEMRGEIVDIESGSLIEAPGANVLISGTVPLVTGIYPDSVFAGIKDTYFPRIYMASDSAIDVSGLRDVSRPMSDNFLTFKPFGNEFADQPLQRNGALRGQQLTVDLRQSGTLNGANWIGTPLANLAGYATSVSRTIDQLLTTGGNVTLSSPQIVLRQNSAINVSGGTVQYAGDTIGASKLLTADGRIVNISRADPQDTFIGVAGVFTLAHPHWGNTTTETFVAPLLAGQAFEPGYTEGRDAGAIRMDAGAYVLDGSLYGGVTAGERQRALGQRPSASDNALAMPNAGTLSLTGSNNLTVSGNVVPLAGNFGAATALSGVTAQTTQLSAQTLSDGSFGNISASFSGQVTVTRDATVTAAPGGAINLSGGSADIEGSLVAHSGAITVDSTAQIAGDPVGSAGTAFQVTTPVRPHAFDLVIGATALLDASGLWVNDNGASPADLVGAAFIDGGSVTLKTEARSAVCTTVACKTLPGLGAGAPAIVDITGDVVLNQGATLDVSSGGRITDRGLLMLDSKGRAAGKGGNIALATYAGGFSLSAQTLFPPTVMNLEAAIRLAGSDGSAAGNAAFLTSALHAYGFSQGGTLSLQAPSFDIGAQAAPGSFVLPASFFAGSGFGAYSFSSVAGHLNVAPGTQLTLQQRNFVPASNLTVLPTGAKVSDVVSLDYLPDFLRQPVNLTLASQPPVIPTAPYDPAAPVTPRTVLSIGDGASINADPGAKVAINVSGRTDFSSASGNGFPVSIAVQIAGAEILGSITAHGGNIALTSDQLGQLWLGANSRLDVSGVALTDSRQTLFRTGTVLAGGTVTIAASDGSSSVVGLKGALIDVSGSSSEFDLPADAKPALGGPQFVATPIWSDAGSIILSSPTLIYDGAFAAHAGSSSGNGGSLTIASPEFGGVSGKENILVRQSGNAAPAGLKPNDPLGALAGSAVLFADRLDGSGIQTLTLTMGQTTGDTVSSSQGKFQPGTMSFSGNVNLAGLNQLFLDASQIALINTVAPTDPRGCNVCLDAGYVALRGAGNASAVFPTQGTGVLQVSANTLDIAAGGFTDSDGRYLLSISGAAKANFISRGDIRLRTPLANVPLELTPGTLPSGQLISAGDLSFTAAQIYPVSSIAFTIKSIAANGTIAFASNGAARTAPLTAGGQITVSAAHIDQSGILLAPLGTIRLGALSKDDLAPNDPTSGSVVATQSVHLGAGSVTSVSLAGQTVPFGQTANGTSWSYDSAFGQPLTAPPAKNLLVSSTAIDLAQGATIDLTGGGDIQAIEFVPGTGGTRDVLAGNANVFAIVPGYDPSAAPVDLDFILQRHDALPAVGSAVFLSGEAGVAPGFYTLLPAHYATLPGAYRVALVANSGNAQSYLNNSLPDGTLRMAGYFANTQSGTRDARLQYFDVQSSTVWRKYSEIDQVSGNSFFGAKPSAAGIVPRLPIDAGHAAFTGVSAINLQGRVLFAPAANGKGSEFDIAAQDIQVLSPGAKALSGYVGLDATQLSGLGVDSLLLGGIRSQDSDGEHVAVVANSVEISNDASAPLQGPEVILVTRVAGNNVDPNGSRGLRLDAGSVVQAKGTMVDPSQKKLIIGSDAKQIAGNGNLLAVSSGLGVDIQRQRVAQNNGVITLAGAAGGLAGATVRGTSITLDTSGNIRPGTGVTLDAANIILSTKSINFGIPVTQPANLVGLNIDSGFVAQLSKASNLTLRSLRTIDFNGPVDFFLGAGSHLTLDSSALVSVNGTGAVRLGAARIDLLNSGFWQNPNASGSASLSLAASQIGIGAGAKSLSGFGAVTISATSRMAMQGSGSLDAGTAALTITTPLLLAGSKSNQSITTGGTVTLAGTGAGAPDTAGEVGGTLALTGSAITLADNADIRAVAGGVTLTATANGVTLGKNARIEANGFVSTFFDVVQAMGGGSVRLVANQGSIDVDPTARIDVSSPTGLPGYAGQLALTAANGNILSQGQAFDMRTIGGSVAGDHGGRLTIDTQSLGTSALALPTMFDDAVDVHLRQGNIQLASDIKAATVSLTVDGGILTVTRSIDASGAKGGSISLFGANGVVIAPGARLLATASDAGKRGGDVLIGTQGSGILDLQGGLIDVSNTVDAANGGTVRLRAPLTGTYDDVAINTVKTAIQGASSVTVEGYRVFKAVDPSSPNYNPATDFNGVIDPIAQPGFFGSCDNQGVCSGTLIDFVQNFALSAAAQAKFAAIPSTVLHLQPGMELANDTGNITVANAWNLGSGIAGYLVSASTYAPKNKPVVPVGTVMTDANGNLLPQYAGYKGDLLFVQGVSQIRSLYYRVGGSVTGEAGALTLRAAGDVIINDSITDGFFNTRNVFDQNYQKNLNAWIYSVYAPDNGTTTTDVTNVGGYMIAGATFGVSPSGAAPLAPYDPTANGISPNFSNKDKTPINGADLFPLIKDSNGSIQDASGNRYSAVNSWSYRIVAGADTASANPLAARPISVFDPAGTSPSAGHGNVVIDGHTRYQVSFQNPDGTTNNTGYATPTIVRTGTGSIDIAAGLDFILADKTAPGVVYTAGRNSVALPDPGFVVQTIADPTDATQQIAMPFATNPEGFLAPQVLSCNLTFHCSAYGPMTQAAYPVAGGHLTVTAQRDIIGYEHPTIQMPGAGASPNQLYFAPWLLAQGTSLSSTAFGAFAPLSGYLSSGGQSKYTPSQTSWWINFGSFDQGLMSVGGDVTVKAGRDIQEMSVSLPTTARVSGGLSSTITDAQGNVVANIPVMHLNGSGDMTVIAGRDIKSGAYYEGSGDARILIGGATSASWSMRTDPTDASSAVPISTVLAVDTGKIALQARGNVDIAGVVSGPSLQNVADPFGAVDIDSQSVSSYGPDSAVSLLSIGGDVVTNSLQFFEALTNNANQLANSADTEGYPGISRYPASFRAVSANGDVRVDEGFRLAASQNGTLDILAHGSIVTSTSALNFSTSSQPISTGPSLVEASFDPVNPLAGFAPAQGSVSSDLGALLLHQNDAAPALFYAATGDIIATGDPNPDSLKTAPLAWEITKPAKVRAARDIIDLSFFGQNLSATDITSIVAGRDIFYTGAWQAQLGRNAGIPALNVIQNLGGLSLAGPGFFEIQAGRNLGPFVTAAADIAAGRPGLLAPNPLGTGIITFGNTVVVGNRRMFSSENPGTAADPFALSANNRLERRGADIVALFGVANGIDYASVIRNYVDPSNLTPAAPRDYIPALQTYLQTLGFGALSRTNAWTAFTALPTGLQQIFADKVFLSEIKLPGNPDGCCYKDYAVAYSMINTLFPASLGYTDNNVTGDAKAVLHTTGNVDLLHATIKTLQSTGTSVVNADGTSALVQTGGDIMLFGPGGSINVGTTALEVNRNLSNSSLGILTLNNGAISVFTDANVLVNQSRILTVQGGDILMFSSNGDLDAGRGAKTSVDFKPLSVTFDPTDLQTINLNGLVSGAGIGTIRSTPDAPAASAALIAPRGTVNAGDAGLRSSGNLDIVALLVLNAANIAFSGKSSGIPESGSVNLGALESTSSTGGQAARLADDSVAAAASRGAQAGVRAMPSLVTVEVLGFGDCDPESGRACAAN